MDEHKVNFSFNNSQFLLFRVNQLNEINTHIESENNMLKRKIQESDDIITEYQNNITILSSKLPEYANSNENFNIKMSLKDLNTFINNWDEELHGKF